MSKIHAKPASRTKYRDIPARISVGREPGQPGAFQACVFLGRFKGKGRHYTSRSACAEGSSPKRAIAAALRDAADHIAQRNSAFAGAKRKRRR